MAKVDAAVGESASFPAPLYGGPVEARSLSSITSIASNPPAYPRNPTQKKLDPLVLYIVRVPGSKDVFLTPLKPPTKYSVSAEAINASLYYLHVAGPEDDILLQEYEQEREEQARLRKEGLIEDPDLPVPAREIARLNNVRRKPVGAPKDTASLDAPPPLPTRPSFSSYQQLENTAPNPLDDSIPPPMMPPRPTLPEISYSASGLPRGEETPPPLPQRPVSNVPRNEPVFDSYTAPKNNNRWSALPGYVSSQVQRGRERYEAAPPVRHSFDGARPSMRPQTSHDLPPPYSAIAPPPRSPGQSPSRLPRDNAPPQQPGFHITLIRRDPTHGSQWNVAAMTTPPSRTDGSGIDIDISTPGYSRFAGHNEPLSLESLGLNLSAEARNILSRQQNTSNPSATLHDPSVPRDTSRPRRFHRKLLVSRPEESRSSLDSSGSRPSLDGGPGSPVTVHSSTFSKLKSGYYTFTSPWNGTCTFSTSVNGRSLKCKHMIPAPGFPNSPNSTQENPAVTVAEIRFNTPFQGSHAHHHHSSEHADPSGPYYYNPSTNPSKRAAIANFINNKFDRRGSNSSTSSAGANEPPPPLPRRPIDEDRIDLSLAREKAGGGMRGNSAKLGKLIIEDEGIKMLDLVVAACMTVWWKGYYY
ncbi:hypothetical protein BJY00DRAFT_238532 [Aspergillus carlsbadensis]|nr:hypothetical protein BJY00DRAFT_238532 [Aspergillus carlsbadensis]